MGLIIVCVTLDFHFKMMERHAVVSAIIHYEYDSHSTNLTVSTGVLAGGTLGVILLSLILIVVGGVCIKCVIVCRQRTNKYISDPHNNCDNRSLHITFYYVLSTEMPNLNLMKLGTTMRKVNLLVLYLFAKIPTIV